MESKKTVIIGATPNPDRYAHHAAEMLQDNQIEFIPIGIKKGNVKGIDILDLRDKPMINGVDTVTLYLNPKNQEEWEDYIIDLNPKRIIFNPGTENPSLQKKAITKQIETLNACTLTMLSVGLY